ncbi:MAG: DMT family transporter, partial [Spirochaetota bacterium]
LTIVGLAIITLSSRESKNPGETTVLGVMFLILAEAGFAIYSTFLRTYMKKYTTLQVAGTAIGVSAIVYAAIYFPELARVNYRMLPVEGWLLVIYSGVAPLVLGNLLWNYSIKHIGSTRASVYGNLPPFFVLLLSALLLGELLNVIQLVGGMVTILGVIIVQLRKPIPISTGD